MDKYVQITNAYDVAELVVKLNNSYDVITVEGDCVCIHQLPRTLGILGKSNYPAKLVRVGFYGGPPGQEDWFQGTLQSYLWDTLMRMEVKYGEAGLPSSLTNKILERFIAV